MPNGESSSIRQLGPADYTYILFSCIAGLWQGWCFTYGSNRLLVLVAIGMSLPFALATYAYALFLNRATSIAERPDWKRMLILWAGMPFSLVCSSLMSMAETRLMYVFGYGTVDLPFYDIRLLIAEGAACLAWAACLLVWSRRSGAGAVRNRFLAAFAVLFVGVIMADGLAYLALRLLNRDLYFYLESVVTTIISALILIFVENKAAKPGRGLDIVAEA